LFWRNIANQAYLFNLQNPTTVKVAPSAMREVVGRSQLAPILVTSAARPSATRRAIYPEHLDSYNAGINITDVQILKVDLPS
jgi:membrane protease subunit HflK